jgi:hypothetical protein
MPRFIVRVMYVEQRWPAAAPVPNAKRGPVGKHLRPWRRDDRFHALPSICLAATYSHK